jgi:hypothetical protein
MPAKGFKSITVRDDVYDYFWKRWKRDEKRLRREQGITSFSGYVSYMLSEMMRREDARNVE